MAKTTAIKRVELKDSGVVFNEAEHTYTLGDLSLSGITGMLSRQLFPDEYKDVDPAILNAAADYGTGVHHACEAYDTEWESDGSIEVEDYKQICIENSLQHEYTEYTVTDGKHWASNIDKVFREGDDLFSLGDLKTYGQMTPEKKEKARWQLSIYAYLFELQNKKAKIDRLFIIHLRNKQKRDGSFDHISEIIFVKRIPSEICKELLEADVDGIQFQNPYAIPEEVKTQEEHIRELIQTKAAIEEELTQIKSKILADMEEKEQKTWATETMRLTRKLPSVRAGFDLKKFRADHPEIDFAPYETETKISGSLTITI